MPHSNESAYSQFPDFDSPNQDTKVDFDLTRNETTWKGGFEALFPLQGHQGFSLYPVPSGETRVCLAVPLQFPTPLGHHTPFWEKIRNDLENHPEGLAFDFGIDFPAPALPIDLGDTKISLGTRSRLTGKVTIRSRNDDEMKVVEDWYLARMKDRVRATNYPWYYAYRGNDYPNIPNTPGAWQGWKELEESLSESTMRDEIRLTRILIQYCDTKDEQVLEELKEWFAGMNEVQRTCMAKSVLGRARGAYGTDLLASFRDLYKAIREYDISAKTESETESLKKLGLLE